VIEQINGQTTKQTNPCCREASLLALAMSNSDPEADVVRALDRLLLQSGVQGGEFGSYFFISLVLLTRN